MNFSSPDTARRCRLDSFLSVHAFNRCLTNSILSTPIQPLPHWQYFSTRVYRCLTNSILSTPILPLSYWQYFSIRVQSLSRQRFSPSTRHALPSQLLSGCLCLITRCHPSVGIQPLSARCCPSPVVGQWGGKGSLPSVSHSRRTNGREAEMSLSSWRWIWSNQDLSNQDGNEDANNN